VSGTVLGLVVATVVFAPARWLAAAIEQASGQRVSLVGARGSVWDGSSQLVLSGGAGSGAGVALPGQVQWRIRPSWIGLQLAIRADCCTPQPLQLQAQASGLGSGRLLLADSQSQWPAGLLSGLGTPWNTIQLQGQLESSTRGLAVEWAQGQLSLSGQLQLDAMNVSSRLSTLSPMGSYRVQLQGGTAPSLQLATLDGSLQLSGQGEWLGQRLRFSGVASAAPERVEALSNLLNIVGRRDGPRSIITVG
jgi:general secretion pathway protein N